MSSPHRILIVYAHPAPHRSRVNRAMALAASALPHIQVHDLYTTYPDFDIDVPAEQALLAAADLVVFQHPIQWYSMPALMKEWLDTVFEDGWAYGMGGTAQHGKHFWLATTTGGDREWYRPGGYHGYAFADFLPAFRQTALLCGMRWREPYVLFGAHQVDDAAVTNHVAQYVQRLASYPHWLQPA